MPTCEEIERMLRGKFLVVSANRNKNNPDHARMSTEDFETAHLELGAYLGREAMRQLRLRNSYPILACEGCYDGEKEKGFIVFPWSYESARELTKHLLLGWGQETVLWGDAGGAWLLGFEYPGSTWVHARTTLGSQQFSPPEPGGAETVISASDGVVRFHYATH